jgi:hypothetical protein
MGNADTKLNFRKAVVQLTSKAQVSWMRYRLILIYLISSAMYLQIDIFSLLTQQMILSGINFGQKV